MLLKALARTVRQDKEIKDILIRKEELKLSLFVDDMILYLEDPKINKKNTMEFIHNFSKMVGYKINSEAIKREIRTPNGGRIVFSTNGAGKLEKHIEQ